MKVCAVQRLNVGAREADFKDVKRRSARSARGGVRMEFLIALMIVAAVLKPTASLAFLSRLDSLLRLFISTLAYGFN